jgi:exopolysaccharide biosynthesis predicted pyruvyltransferase EpsI
MEIIKRCVSRIRFLFEFSVKALSLIVQKERKTIYLFGSPAHSNMGDQAQTYCIEKWCNKYIPGYDVFIFQLYFSNPFMLKILRRIIHKEDILFCHSGYHITDLNDEKRAYFNVIRLFPDFPVTIFPQTVHFVRSKEEETRTGRIFDAHPDLTLLCRDAVSYSTAGGLFQKTRLLPFPDIVTTLIGFYSFTNKRDGVLLCKRNDIESFYSADEVDGLISRLNTVTKIDITDTTLKINYRKIIRNRKEVLERIFDQYSRYAVIITDRYHGVIFSLIAGTPVIILKLTNHKLTSGVDWFPQDIFDGYLTVAENLEEAYNLALEKINNPVHKKLPAYFQEHYYSRLIGQLHLGGNLCSAR